MFLLIQKGDLERGSNGTFHNGLDWSAVEGFCGGITLFKLTIQSRIIGLIDNIPNADFFRVKGLSAEFYQNNIPLLINMINTTALNGFFGFRISKRDTVSGLDGFLSADTNASSLNSGDFADAETFVSGKTRMAKVLLIDPFHPACSQTAREGHFQLIAFFFQHLGQNFTTGHGLKVITRKYIPGCIDSLAIDAADAADIFRTFQPSFNFENGDSGVDQIGDHFQPQEIFGTEKKLFGSQRQFIAVEDQLIGKTAGLSAFSTVRGTPSQCLTG